MELIFLGTGAADTKLIKNCTDKDYRRYSSAIIDGKILIDVSEMAFDSAETFGVDLSKVGALLITHGHNDHFTDVAVKKLLKLNPAIKVYGSEFVKKLYSGDNFNVLSDRTEIDVCGYSVVPLKSNHMNIGCGDTEQGYNYVIKKDKTLFYGLDGTMLPTLSWYHLLKKEKLDACVIDYTLGELYGDYRIFEHNNRQMVRLIYDTLLNNKVINGDCKFILSHLSHAHDDHKTEEELMRKEGKIVAYDGMRLTV